MLGGVVVVALSCSFFLRSFGAVGSFVTTTLGKGETPEGCDIHVGSNGHVDSQ